MPWVSFQSRKNHLYHSHRRQHSVQLNPACVEHHQRLGFFLVFSLWQARVHLNIKRITKYNEKKQHSSQPIPPSNLLVLYITVLEQNIIKPLQDKVFSLHRLPSSSILTTKKSLSYRTFQPIDILPDSKNDDDLWFSSYLDGSSHTTTVICNFCYDDFSFKSTTSMRNHISTMHRSEILSRLKTNYIAYPRSEVMWFLTILPDAQFYNYSLNHCTEHSLIKKK